MKIDVEVGSFLLLKLVLNVDPEFFWSTDSRTDTWRLNYAGLRVS